MSQSLDQILVSLKNMNDPVIFAEAYITANYTANSEVEQLKSRIAWLEGKIEGLSNDNLTPHLTPHLTPKKLPRFEP